MAINKGYLTAKTDKASDEVYTQHMLFDLWLSICDFLKK